MGRLKSRKNESLGLTETVAFECKLFTEVVEAGEFLAILMAAMEVGDDAPVVEGNSFGTEIFVGPLATSLNGMEEPSGSRGDGERGVAWGGKDFFNILLFICTQLASDISKASFDLKYLEKGLFAFKRPQRQLRQYRRDFGKKNVDLD